MFRYDIICQFHARTSHQKLGYGYTIHACAKYVLEVGAYPQCIIAVYGIDGQQFPLDHSHVLHNTLIQPRAEYQPQGSGECKQYEGDDQCLYAGSLPHDT